MKSITTLCITLVCLYAVLSVGTAAPQASVFTQDMVDPSELDTAEVYEQEQPDQPERRIPVELLRRKRISCDLLSGLGWNHSICAGHCLAISWRYRGGYCNDRGVCVCRS
ncbi:defensin-C-like [Aedes albopictus]|uniref:Putative defensin-c n=1 Tax=Aedes albopictus TaxID=7160 RepID=A0A1W7R8R9_AEDAL